MSRPTSSSARLVSLEATATDWVLRNAAGVCRIRRATGVIEAQGHEGPASVALRLEPFVASAAQRWSTSIAARLATSARGSQAVEIECDFGREGPRLHCRVAAEADGFVVEVGRSGAAAVTELGLHGAAPRLARGRRPSVLKLAYCGAHSRSLLSRSEVQALTRRSDLRSWWATALFDAADQSGFVLGYLSARRFAGSFAVRGFAFDAAHGLEGVVATQKRVVWSEPLWIAPTMRVTSTLLDYGRAVGRASGRRAPVAPQWGWGSWGHFGDAITAPTVRRNAAAIRALAPTRRERPVIHVDHGWEQRLQPHRPKPTWEPRPEFRGSIARLARDVRMKGGELRLWVVPFALNISGPLPRALRGVVVCDPLGQPTPIVGSTCYGVDPTSPAGEAWLRRLFRKFRRWGVAHYKLDFLRVLMGPDPENGTRPVAPRRFHRPVTRLEAYRRGLEIIRETVGPRAHLLGCGAPLLPNVGLVDSCRVGSDIEPEWEHGHTGIRHCAGNVQNNFFWHGAVWANDPDFLVVPREERLFRYWAAAVAFSGGTTLVSADVPALSVARQRLLQRFLPALPGGVPMELQPAADGVRIAQALTLDGESYALVACFNPRAQARIFSLAAHELGLGSDDCIAWDVLRSRAHGKPAGAWRIPVGARGVAILGVRRLALRPQLVATSGHLAMGAVELARVEWRGRARRLRCVRRAECPWPERLYFHVPAGFRLARDPRLATRSRSAMLELDLRGVTSRVVTLSFPQNHEGPRQNRSRRR